MDKKVLIAYFSASGVTAGAAKAMAQAVGADLYEIHPQQPYTAADLDWRNKQSRSSVEMQTPESRPALAEALPDVAAYDVVFVGFPIWWGVEPRVVDTFLEGLDLTDKTLIPFATSGGSGMAYAQRYLQAHYPQLHWQTGSLVHGRDAAAFAKHALDDCG